MDIISSLSQPLLILHHHLVKDKQRILTSKLVSKKPCKGLKQELPSSLSLDCKADLLLPIILTMDLLQLQVYAPWPFLH